MKNINLYCEKNGLAFKEWIDSSMFKGRYFVKYYYRFYKEGKEVKEGVIDVTNKGVTPHEIEEYSMKPIDEYNKLIYPVLEAGRQELCDNYIVNL